MPNSSSSDSDDHWVQRARPFGRERSIRDILGGGKVADVLMWKDKRVSATILIGIGILWFLFEVIEYNFLTLLCHILMSAMLVVFIWDKGADMFRWAPPRIPDMFSHKSTIREVAAMSRAKLEQFLSYFCYIATGNDFRQFFLAIGSLWILSAIGNYISTLNLLFFGCLCLETLPYFYDKYEDEVDYIIVRMTRSMKKSYKKFDKEFLRKIPRGPVKQKKDK